MARTGGGCVGRRAAIATIAFAALAFAGSAEAQDDDWGELDDLLGGFEEESDGLEVDEEAMAALATEELWWDVSGSAEISGTFNFREHESDTGTDYFGLQRLRNRGNLQLDVELGEMPFLTDGGRRELEGWKFRFGGWAFYDAAYLINGRGRYTQEVRNEYEWDMEVSEFWIQGALFPALDLKLGRQVVIWGRSESLRVLDVLNPLDNREPGRVDLEDLRRPLGMVKLDGYIGDWTITGIAIPEIRFDLQPVRGSDFFPGTMNAPERVPGDWEDTEAAAAITGTFEGWDISFHGAWFWNDRARLGDSGTVFVHDRLWMVGAGGNYTWGSFLLKGEFATIGGLGFFGADSSKERVDALVGIEYYGFTNTTTTVEVVNRTILDYEDVIRSAPNFTRQNSQEVSFRITRNFMNERVEATALAILLGITAKDGSIFRFDVNYDIRDALNIGIGILFYEDGDGDLPPLNRWTSNDRIFFNLKYSF